MERISTSRESLIEQRFDQLHGILQELDALEDVIVLGNAITKRNELVKYIAHLLSTE